MPILALLLFTFFPVSANAANRGVELLLWQLPGYDFAFVLPKLADESPSAARARYLKKVGELPELNSFITEISKLGEGTFSSWPNTNDGPIALGMATMFEDTKPTSGRMHRLLDPMTERGWKSLVLLPGTTLTLSKSKAASFRAQINEKVNLLMAPGGFDIDPKYYGQTNSHSKGISAMLDKDHLSIISSFFKNGDGLFAGICLGAQKGAVVSGCSLVQSLEKQLPGSLQHWTTDGKSSSHGLQAADVRPGSITEKIMRGEDLITHESRHRQGIVVPQGNKTAIVTAVSPGDNVPEILEFLNHRGELRGIGLQFHPERESTELKDRVFQAINEKGDEYYQKQLSQQCMKNFAIFSR